MCLAVIRIILTMLASCASVRVFTRPSSHQGSVDGDTRGADISTHGIDSNAGATERRQNRGGGEAVGGGGGFQCCCRRQKIWSTGWLTGFISTQPQFFHSDFDNETRFNFRLSYDIPKGKKKVTPLHKGRTQPLNQAICEMTEDSSSDLFGFMAPYPLFSKGNNIVGRKRITDEPGKVRDKIKETEIQLYTLYCKASMSRDCNGWDRIQDIGGRNAAGVCAGQPSLLWQQKVSPSKVPCGVHPHVNDGKIFDSFASATPDGRVSPEFANDQFPVLVDILKSLGKPVASEQSDVANVKRGISELIAHVYNSAEKYGYPRFKVKLPQVWTGSFGVVARNVQGRFVIDRYDDSASGFLDRYNSAKQFDDQIVPGDTIVEVNDVEGDFDVINREFGKRRLKSFRVQKRRLKKREQEVLVKVASSHGPAIPAVVRYVDAGLNAGQFSITLQQPWTEGLGLECVNNTDLVTIAKLNPTGGANFAEDYNSAAPKQQHFAPGDIIEEVNGVRGGYETILTELRQGRLKSMKVKQKGTRVAAKFFIVKAGKLAAAVIVGTLMKVQSGDEQTALSGYRKYCRALERVPTSNEHELLNLIKDANTQLKASAEPVLSSIITRHEKDALDAGNSESNLEGAARNTKRLAIIALRANVMPLDLKEFFDEVPSEGLD